MHKSGRPALSSVVFAAKNARPACQHAPKRVSQRRGLTIRSRDDVTLSTSNATLRRCFHSSPASRAEAEAANPAPEGGSGAGGSKPAIETVEKEDNAAETETQAAQDTIGGRRISGANNLRHRLARRRNASVLPAVNLPANFLDEHVSLHEPHAQPRTPRSIENEARISKTSVMYSGNGRKDPRNVVAEVYFSAAMDMLGYNLETNLKKIIPVPKEDVHDEMEQKNATIQPEDMTKFVETVGAAVKGLDMIIDAAWHLTDSIYPARKPEYVYKERPYWWWQLLATEMPGDAPAEISINSQHFFEQLKLHPAQALANFPLNTFGALYSSMLSELETRAPPGFEAKTGKRPITIVSTSGFSGASISESVAANLACLIGSDVVHLNAANLGNLVGDYLGQNQAYNRGAASMLGYRAAELSGRTPRDPEAPAPRPREDDDEEESPAGQVITLTGRNSLEEELNKIRGGSSLETFNKWDSLKIDKLLDEVIRSARIKSGGARDKPVIIHLHDAIELSMTLEGAYIIQRLRQLVDAAWQQGSKIVILGTSSTKTPSDEYQSMVSELAQTDFVISRDLRPVAAPGKKVDDDYTRLLDSCLGQADIFLENAANVNRMIAAMDPSTKLRFNPSDDVLRAITGLLEKEEEHLNPIIRSLLPIESDLDTLQGFRVTSGQNDKEILPELAEKARAEFRKRTSQWVDSVLPVSEVYHIARQYMMFARAGEGLEDGQFLMRSSELHPLQQRSPSQVLEQAQQKDAFSEAGRSEVKTDERLNIPGLNSYEKRIAASGLVQKKNLRVTFNDVHVPKETTSSLKLLTTLSLLRPDAFTYGVLLSDKIPGCLLYGPPGTGKTMLAKAVATSSNANMLELSGASINDKWVGESEKLIRAVFTLARKLKPCVVFIDEADAMLARRGGGGDGGSGWRREGVNQFLREWDGMEEGGAFVMVATNRPFDLDDAVLRRLPRKILVDLPNKDDRLAILKLLLKDEQLASDVNLQDLADRTPFYSGSDLKNVCVAAAMTAVEEENTAAEAFNANNPNGEQEYEYPEKRTLTRDHFEKGIKQIPASISEDMPSLKSIRKFDEEYGDGRKKSRKRGMGFGGGEVVKVNDDAKIRPGL